ncbi:hypothetical protein PAPHI01_2389 [Pancytospora philotis]|nr:hypothetical protein PAPHI01_2389 [Pancytospora philotis]
MLIVRSMLYFLAMLWLAVSLDGALVAHPSHNSRPRRHHRHQHSKGIQWIKELGRHQRNAVESSARTGNCFNRDASKGSSAAEHLKEINQCRAEDARSTLSSEQEVQQPDLMQVCNPDFHSPAYGKDEPYGRRLRGDAQSMLANSRGEAGLYPALYVGYFLNGLIEPLYSMIAADLKPEEIGGEPQKSRLYDFYVNDAGFLDFLEDVKEGRTQSAGFITLQELEDLKELLSASKSLRKLSDEEKLLFNRFVFDTSVFHAFTLAKAMSKRLNFGVEFDEEMTVQAFADALRSYFDTVGRSFGAKKFSFDVERMFEDVGFFSLAYVKCDGKTTQMNAKYNGEERKADLSECFIDEVDVFITSLLNVFNAWGRAPYGITSEALEQTRAKNAKWAAQNKGEPLSKCG